MCVTESNDDRSLAFGKRGAPTTLVCLVGDGDAQRQRDVSKEDAVQRVDCGVERKALGVAIGKRQQAAERAELTERAGPGKRPHQIVGQRERRRERERRDAWQHCDADVARRDEQRAVDVKAELGQEALRVNYATSFKLMRESEREERRKKQTNKKETETIGVQTST